MKNYYQLLGIDINASKEEIKKAYRLYATKFHPDKQKGDVFFEERFKEINDAYNVLSNDIKRDLYDNKLNSNKSKNNINDTIFNSSLREKENELKRKENLLKIQEIEIEKKLKKLEVEKNNDFIKWEKEKTANKTSEFNEREKTVYFKKGNVLITGNSLKIGNVRYELNEIHTTDISVVSKKRFRLTGWILLIFGILTLVYIIGYLISIIAIFFIVKKDKAFIFLTFTDHRFYKIESEKKLALKILESIEKAKYTNKKKYHKY